MGVYTENGTYRFFKKFKNGTYRFLLSIVPFFRPANYGTYRPSAILLHLIMGKLSCSEVEEEEEGFNGTIDNKGRQNIDKCHFLQKIWEV